MGSPVVHFEIVAKDAPGLQKFYSEMFDWKIDANNPMNYGVVDTGTEKGIQGGISPPQDPTSPGYVTFYIEVDDINVALKKAESLGAKTVLERSEIPKMVTLALFNDPAGNLVGLVEEAIPE